MRKYILALAAFVFIFFLGCEKESGNSEKTQLRVNLTDNPFNATEVNVEILEVKANFSNSGWMDLQTNAGVYDLLGLQNGVDTLLALGTVPLDVLKEIRFVLGSDNSIVINNNLYPLTIPSGSESGLKIKIDKQLNATLDSVLIDFDAALSIIQTGAGEFKLKPVLKVK